MTDDVTGEIMRLMEGQIRSKLPSLNSLSEEEFRRIFRRAGVERIRQNVYAFILNLEGLQPPSSP